MINSQGLQIWPVLHKLKLSPLYYKGFTKNIKCLYNQHKLQGGIYVVIIINYFLQQLMQMYERNAAFSTYPSTSIENVLTL